MAVNIGEGTNVINLLFITIKNGKNGYRGHYALIKNLDIFLASKTKSNQQYKKFFCVNCLTQFKEEDSEKFKKHKYLCVNKFQQEEKMPDEDQRVEFKNFDAKYQTEVKILIFFHKGFLL